MPSGPKGSEAALKEDRDCALVVAGLVALGLVVVVALNWNAGPTTPNEKVDQSTPTVAPPAPDANGPTGLEFTDTYLEGWFLHNMGESDQLAEIEAGRDRFEKELTRLLLDEDARAPSRLVFYAVVQGGGAIPVDSDLGRAAEPILGAAFPVRTSNSRPDLDVYFAADLYFWWEENRDRYAGYDLYDTWHERDLIQETVLPMYRKVRDE